MRTTQEIKDFLLRKIELCKELGDLDREEVAFISVLKFIRDGESVCTACSGSGRYCGNACGACDGTGYD